MVVSNGKRVARSSIRTVKTSRVARTINAKGSNWVVGETTVASTSVSHISSLLVGVSQRKCAGEARCYQSSRTNT